MNILLSLACVLVAVTAHITYVYLRRRNSFLRKLQGPESSSFWLGIHLDLPSSAPVSLIIFQEMRENFVTKTKLETTNSGGCGNTVVHGAEVVHSE